MLLQVILEGLGLEVLLVLICARSEEHTSDSSHP